MATKDDDKPDNKPDPAAAAEKAASDEVALAKKRERAAAKAKGEAGKKKGPVETGPAPKYKRDKPPRLKKTYDDTVRPAMMKEFNYGTIMQVPRVMQVTINMGLGKSKDDHKII